MWWLKNRTIAIWIRNKVKSMFGLYDIGDLQIGGHCGCCGKWIPDEIFEKDWSWGICKGKCKDEGKEIPQRRTK